MVEIDNTSMGKDQAFDLEDKAHGVNNVLASQGCISCWVQLVGKGKVIANDLENCVRGDEFACVHNKDSSDFMNATCAHVLGSPQ